MRTKILIKNPRTVFDLETRLRATKHTLATKIKSAWRGHAARVRYARLKTAVIRCQWLARKRLRYRRMLRTREQEMVTRKIVFVQKNVRRMLAVRAYKRKLNAALTIGSFIKAFLTRNDPPNAHNRRFVVYKQTRYLMRLSETLPKSLLDDRWPEPPACCAEASAYLKVLYRAWLSRIYRLDLAKRPETHERLKFKLTASEIFKGRKSMYPKSLKTNLDCDREGVLRQLINAVPEDEKPNTTYLYATGVTKFDRRGYRRRERALAVTTGSILIVEKTCKNRKIKKDRLPLKHVTSLQMTSGMDCFLLIKVSEQLDVSKGDVLLEVPHLVECVTVISKQLPNIVNFVDMQTNSCMKHEIKNSKNPGFIEFIPVAVPEREGEIRKGNNGNLTITSWTNTN